MSHRCSGVFSKLQSFADEYVKRNSFTYIGRRIQVISLIFFHIKKVCVHELESRNLGMPRVSACVILHFA